mmetsp:Transcript_30089/g.71629  ORF Transcript_30089/g.71629 Transcript_30089/m.71629 type:complete len:272 (+) Transcript_30089:2065-2880(+)
MSPTWGSCSRSSGRKVSEAIRPSFKWRRHCRAAAASFTTKASAIAPNAICRAKSKRFWVGSSSSLMRPSTAPGNLPRSSSATRWRCSSRSSWSRRALTESTSKLSCWRSSMRDSRKDPKVLTSSSRCEICLLVCSTSMRLVSSEISRSVFSRLWSSSFPARRFRFSSRSRRSSLLIFTSCAMRRSFSSASRSLSRALVFSCSVFWTACSYSRRCAAVSFTADSTCRPFTSASSSSAFFRRSEASCQSASSVFIFSCSCWILACASRSLMVQ